MMFKCFVGVDVFLRKMVEFFVICLVEDGLFYVVLDFGINSCWMLIV